MARITVEDCLENVKNRFDLVLKASKRARELSMGAEATLPWDNDKPTVMALREIAENTILTRELEAAEHFDIDVSQSTTVDADVVEVETDVQIEVDAAPEEAQDSSVDGSDSPASDLDSDNTPSEDAS